MRQVWFLLEAVSLLAVPQLLGALVFFRLQRYQQLVAHLIGFLLAISSFLFLSYLFWVYLPAKAHPEERCGLPILGAISVVLLGTLMSACFSVVIQLALHRGHRLPPQSVSSKQ